MFTKRSVPFLALVCGLAAALSLACRSHPTGGSERTGALTDRLPTELTVSIVLPAGVSRDAVALGANGALRVDDRVRTLTPTGASAAVANAGTSETNIGVDAVTGSVTSQASVVLRERARVVGDLVTAGTVVRQNGTSVSGTTTEHATLTPPVLFQWTASVPTDDGGPVSLEPGTSRTLAPGAYTDVTVKPNATLSLSAGAYFARSFDIEPQAKLRLDKSNGPIVIYVTGNTLIFRGVIVDLGGPPSDFLIAYLGSAPVSIEAPFTGSVVAPGASLNFASTSIGHRGSFFSRDLEVQPGTPVTLLLFPWNTLGPPSGGDSTLPPDIAGTPIVPNGPLGTRLYPATDGGEPAPVEYGSPAALGFGPAKRLASPVIPAIPMDVRLCNPSCADNLAWSYTHVATDYASTVSELAADGPGVLPNLTLKRFFKPRFSEVVGSFGNAMFSNLDRQIVVVTSEVSQRFILSFDPENDLGQVLWEEVDAASGDTSIDGVFHTASRVGNTISLLRADGSTTPNPFEAATAVLLDWADNPTVFELYSDGSARVGRLQRLEDANGNAIVVTYKFAADTPPEEHGDDPSKLHQYDTVTDAYGLRATFDYVPAPIGVGWVISAIHQPNGASIAYAYTSERPGDADVGPVLQRVTYPDGSTADFSNSIESATRFLVVHVDDRGAAPGDAVKDIYLTQRQVRRADGSLIEQQPNLVRQVVNGSGEVTRANWDDPSRPGVLYTYEGGGRLSRLVRNAATGAPEELSRARQFDPTRPPAEAVFDRVESYQTDAVGLLMRTTDATGLSLEWTHDPLSQAITSTRFPDGSVQTRSYGARLRLTEVVDRNGQVNRHTYDARGNLLSQTQGVGTAAFSRVSFQYNARGQVTRKTDARGNVTDYAYDSRGFLVSLTEPADRPGAPRPIKRYEFDAAGRLSATVDAAGRRRVLGYDVRNRRISTTYPDATTETATYDRGLVIAEKDRNGTVTEMSYDAATRLVERRSAAGTPAEVVDTRSYLNGTLDMTTEVKRGEQTIHSYDAKGRIVAVTRLATAVAGGALTSQTVYDAVGRKTSDADPYGRRTFYFWDFNSHLRRSVRELVPGAAGSSPATLPRVLEANPGYVIEERATSGTGEVLLAVDGVGAQTRNRYDAVGRLVEETTADGTPAAATCRYVYDAAGNLVQKLHPRTFSEGGTFTTSYTYNGRNLVSSETRGAGTAAASTTRTTYSPTGQRATVADPRGNVTTYTYAAGDDRLIAETDPTGAVKRYQHDAAGNLSATTDANGNVVAMTFDALNRPVTQTNGAGETSTIRYDDNLTDGVGIDAELNLAGLGLGAGADGSAIAETDPAGGTRYTVRDGIGRMVLVQDPNGNATRSSHDAVSGGLVATTTTDALGHVTVVLQDGNGGVRQLIDAEGKATTRTHDAVGRLLSFRDATGAGQTCSLDARGRSTSCTDTQGVVIRFAYDTDDNQVSRTDGAGRTTTCTYDALDRLTGCVDRLGSQRRYAYDTVSNLTSITDAEGAVTSYVYDTRNLLTETRFADGGVARTSYDPAARAATQTDPNGVRIVNSYDRANRLVRRGFPDGLDDAFRYDGASRLIQGTSARYQNVFDRSYDLGGRLVSETLTIGGVARSVRSTYDAADRRTRIDYPDGRAVGLAYTPRNLLLALSVNGVATAAYTHDDAGRIATRTFSNGTTETDTYRADGLLATAALTGASRLAYTYDQNKKVLQERRNGTAFDAFQYDPEERLVRWTRSTNTQVFDLGAEADFRTVTTNGVAQAFAHNAVHAVTQVAGRPLVYDQRGNLLSDDQGRTLAWDPAGRIRRATVGGTTVDYGYDAFGRRITRTSGGITTLFVFDGMQVIDEYENGVVARAYLNGPQIDEPVAMLTPERTLFYARQLNKSVYALLDGSGAVVERYEYTPYGRQTIRSPGGAIRTASAFGNPIGFTGRYLDAATGLVDMRTRDYSPSLGIFTSRDNAYQNGLSLYRAYFAPDGSDPTGHFSLSSVASNIVGGVQKVVSEGAAVAKQVANVAETTAVKVADTILQEAGDFAVGVGHDIYHTGSNGVEWGRRFAVDGLDALVWVETRIPVLAITMGFTPLAIAQLGVAAYNWASSDPIKELEDGSSRLWDFGKASIGLGLWTMTELTPSITFAGRSLFPNDVTTQIGIAFGIGYSIAKGDFTPIPHLDWAAGGLVYVFHVPDFGGLTLGRTIIVDPSLDPEAYPRTAGRGIEVMPHEKAHVYQFQTLGENYLPAHAVEKAIYYSAFVSNPENLPLEKGAYNAPHEQPWPWPL